MLSIIKAEHALTIQPFISTKQTRYYLNGFALQPTPLGGVVVATNGRILGVINATEAKVHASVIVQLDKQFLAKCKMEGLCAPSNLVLP